MPQIKKLLYIYKFNKMNDLKQFLKSVPNGIWIIILIFILVIFALPMLFTLPGFIDFSETGQIGDTIGGTMGPFIAILAALLTFFAFWTQFDANRELINENRRNHFENHFYKMLDIHLENVANLNKGIEETKADSCFQVWCNEILNLFNMYKMQSDLGGFIDYIKKKYENEPTQKEFLQFLTNLQESSEEHQKVIFEITYSYFFNGGFSEIKYKDSDKTEYIRQFSSLFTTYLQSYCGFKYNSKPKNELLGRYYRHLFQIVKLVDEQDNNLFTEKHWKGKYIGILRSQMSDYEQLLLFYNAQSSLGKAWDDKKYIENYRLIKNIPYNAIAFCAGESPWHRYYNTIQALEEKGEKFFEKE